MMRAAVCAALLGHLGVVAAGGPWEQENFDDSAVRQMTSADFTDKSLFPMLVDFYAPWCGASPEV